MAEIFYNTRLDNGTWTNHPLAECSGLTHHAFVRFEGVPANGIRANFLAIYDLNHPPAHSLNQPWQGGVTFLRVRPAQENRQDSGPSADYLIVALNRALKQERDAQPVQQRSPALDAHAIANCFVSISGDVVDRTGSANDTTEPVSSAPPTGVSPEPISGLFLLLTSKPGFARTQRIKFDKDGSISEAHISITPK